MKKISGSTFLLKKLIPTLVFIFLGLNMIVLFLPGTEESPKLLKIAPLILACLAYLFFKKTAWDLADIVYDNGDELIFHKGRKEQRVNLRDIINISYSSFNSPQRIEIHLKSNGEIGKMLVFRPPIRLIPFGKNPLALELIERVESAKKS